MDDFKYFQFASPFQSPRMITTADDVDKYWNDYSGDNTGRTWQFFDNSLNDYCKQNGNTSRYRGTSYSPIIPIDIDSHCTVNLFRVLDRLGFLMGDLTDIGLFFSGKKGYHIEIPSAYFGIEPSENLPERMKAVVTQMNIDADLSLYKSNQLYRMNNSLNVDGGYYKTQLDYEEIIDGMPIEEIRTLSSKPTAESFEMYELPDIEPKEWLVDLWNKTTCPDTTKFVVNGGVNEGSRNANAYDSALSLKTQEYSRETAYQVVVEQNKKNNPPEPNLKELLRTVDSAYDGNLYKKYPINPVLHHLQEDAYWNELNDKRKVIYIRMLMEANVREHIWMGERIRRNQFIYGKVTTAKRWAINQDTLRSIFDKFETDGIISKKVINQDGLHKFTIITILSFDVTHPFTHSFSEHNDNW